jgi:hypothetical protein
MLRDVTDNVISGMDLGDVLLQVERQLRSTLWRP